MKAELQKSIRTIPDWPRKGVMFRDITTLLKKREMLQYVIELLVNRYSKMKIDAVAGIEARGFITGSILAHRLNTGFIPLRKEGKLPAKTVSVTYNLEYGTDTIEVHADAVKKGDRILIVDDLIATGGTALAACQLVEKLGGEVVEFNAIINLPDLGGEKKLREAGYSTYTLIDFEGE